jgi:hypothetical protein
MTAEQLLRMSEETSLAFKKKQVTASLFLDAEAAFDKAWQDAICYKINQNLNLPQRLVHLISSFITNRQLVVKVGDHKSHSVTMKAGTPQGSSLSPLLYIIMVNDIPPQVTEYSSISQFADDIGLWCHAYTRAGARYRLQQSVNILEGWCRKWRIKLNGDKSKLMYLQHISETSTEDASIQLFDDIIKPSSGARFLGIEFDDRLNYKTHFDALIKKANTRMNIFRILRKGGVDNKTMIRMYKMYIRPLFEYGSICFISAAASEMKKFQVLQNEFLRVCLRIPRYIRSDLLHEAAGIETIKERLDQLSNRIFGKIRGCESILELIETYNGVIPLNEKKSPLDYLLR